MFSQNSKQFVEQDVN